jgi:phage tail sheath gpL-like
MSALTIQNISAAGITPSYQAATASDTIPGASGNERLFLHAKNTNAATATVTINPVSPTTAKVPGVGQVSVPAIQVTIPATTGDKMIGPIPQAYIDATGTVTITNTGTITNLTLAAIALPAASL